MANEPKFDIVWPGSMPAGMDPEKAQRMLLTEIGPFAKRVPPQEPPDWIVPLLLALADHPDLEIARPGKWTDYKDQQRYRIKKGHQFREEFIDVGIENSVRGKLGIFTRLRDEFDVPPKTIFGLSTKGVADFAFFAFGLKGLLKPKRYLTPFLDATIREMHTVIALPKPSGVRIGFNLEVPVPTVFACKMGPLRPAFMSWLAAGVTKLAAGAPRSASCGVHLCYGDLGHHALAKPRTLAPVVALANAIAAHWPGPAPLDYIHIPMASAEQRPSLVEGYYRPLKRLRLNSGTQLVAGFLHEDLGQDDAAMIAAWVTKYETLARRATESEHPPRVALAPSCGCGRRSETATLTVLRQGAALCGGTTHGSEATPILTADVVAEPPEG